jgi:hypothetical protein
VCQRRWLSGTMLASLELDSGLESQHGHLFFGTSPRGKEDIVVEMSAERRGNGLGLGGVMTAHGGEDGTVMG